MTNLVKERCRFERYVHKTDFCWLWKGSKTRGYGQFYFRGKRTSAHRAALVIYRGEKIPLGKVVMHSCDNPSCVNPQHLSVGTHTDNMRDAAKKGRIRNVNDWAGTKNPKAKLSESDLILLRDLMRTMSAGELSERFGVTKERIWQIRKQWRNSGVWQYEEYT